MVIAGFDWDSGNRNKCQKHGVPIEEIEGALSSNPRIVPDLKHSTAEDRFIAIGHTSDDRPIFIAFVVREIDGVRLIRPISARYMHQKERKAYGA